jgi:rhodanese-related sulfurtransferase
LDKMVDELLPDQVWDALLSDPDAQLVDVRTEAEWSWVGLPDLGEAGKKPVLISWQLPPKMEVNAGFVAQLREAGLTPGQKLYFLCRSGARSLSAAKAAVAAGFPHAFNVAGGFEGPLDGAGHRGATSGWKASGLPWRQS